MDEFKFHHVGVAVRDMQSAILAYQCLFGYELVSGPFDDPIQKVSVCFVTRGGHDPVVELVAALGPDSPVDRVLKQGGGTYHICYEVPDLRKSIDQLKAKGSFLMSEPAPAVAFGMREIAWLLSDDACLLIELLQAQ